MSGGRPGGFLHGGRPRVGEPPVRDDVARELEAHLALAQEELEARGWTPAEAREEALRRFGDRARVQARSEAEVRRGDARTRRTMGWEGMMQDVRYAVRSLRRNPGFAWVALVTLALGIGANTAIFSLVHGVLLAPLPHPDAHRLVALREQGNAGGEMDFAWANARDLGEYASSFSALTAWVPTRPTVTGGAEPVQVSGAMVSRDFWKVFPVAPVQGRTTLPEEHRDGEAQVVILAEPLAQRLFGTDRVVGRTVGIRGVDATIVGVVPGGFDTPHGSELWVPVEAAAAPGESRTAHNFEVAARLAPGVTPEQAQAEASSLVRAMVTDLPDENPDYLALGGVSLRGLREEWVGDVRRPLLLLMGAAGLVLLVACTNLASTLLARGATRHGEMAVRSSLGAGRGRLVRQLLTEALVLSGAGVLLGLVVAKGVLALLVGQARDIPRLDGVGLSPAVLLFALALAGVTALLFGLLPAVRVSDAGRRGSLREGRGITRGARRLWAGLVVAEVAVALVLLTGTGLLLRSFAAVLEQEPGVDASDVVVTAVALPQDRYPELQDHARWWSGLLAELEADPSVEAAGLLSVLPAQGFVATGLIQADGDPDNVLQSPAYVVASPGAFEALDIPLLSGRLFDETDGPDAPHAVVVNQAFVDRFWPGEQVLGRTVSGGGMDNHYADGLFGTVVGVVGNVRHRSLVQSPLPAVYWHHAQRPFRVRYGGNLVVEAAEGASPEGLVAGLRDQVRGAEPDVVLSFRWLERELAASVADRRFLLTVLAAFAGLALLLAAVGIHGVVSWTAAQRNREMGIRLALGSDPGDVRRMVVRGALGPVLLGLALGVGGSVASGRALQALLFGISPSDPATLAGVVLLLLCAAVAAIWLPARRSARVDPVRALREG